MNFSVKKEDLVQLLYLSSTIVNRKHTMPILANVFLGSRDSKLFVAASDLEVSIEGQIPADVRIPGSITVSGGMFYDIVRELPSDTVNIEVVEGQRVHIQCAQSRFKMLGTSGDEYPSIMGTTLVNPISVDAQKLYDMLDKTAYAVSTDETRYNINGVNVESLPHPIGNDTEGIRFAATDGHRLAMVDRPADGLDVGAGAILPRKALAELKRLLEENHGSANVSFNEGFFTVESVNIRMGIRLLDGQYPNYRNVIPVDFSTVVRVNRGELLSGVKRVAIVSTEKTRAIRLKVIGDTMLLSSSSPERGEATESLQIAKEGADVTIGFSATYIVDLLNAMGSADSVTIKFSGDEGATLFTGSEDEYYSCIVMPMHFN